MAVLNLTKLEKKRAYNRERSAQERKEKPDLVRKRNKIWRDNNPEYNVNQHLKRTYGITKQEWVLLFLAQNNKCAVCQRNNAKRWHTDHDHKTGQLRGILCPACNLFVGQIENNPTLITQAMSYIKCPR